VSERCSLIAVKREVVVNGRTQIGFSMRATLVVVAEVLGRLNLELLTGEYE
jgi:hypothetical protein